MPRTSILRPLCNHIVSFHFIPDVVYSQLFLCLLSSLSLRFHVQHLFGGSLPFLPQHLDIPYQSYVSEEGYWFDVGFSADDFILDVVLISLSSSPSQHSHLTGVYVLCIVMWNVNMYSGLSQTNPFYLLPFRCYRIIKIPENTFRNFSTLEPIARMCIT